MKISVLLASRKNSKFLSKFLYTYRMKTGNLGDVELHCMYSAEDTWNREIISYARSIPGLYFYEEDKRLGREGLHVYYNDLLQFSNGEWVIYFCDDHHIARPGWDQVLIDFILDNRLNPERVYSIVPTWDNTGSVNQMLSRGYIKALGNIGRFGNIDSYNNFVAEGLPYGRVLREPTPLFHDFTCDPWIMTPEHCKLDNKAENAFPQWGSPEVNAWIKEDHMKLLEAIKNEL